MKVGIFLVDDKKNTQLSLESVANYAAGLMDVQWVETIGGDAKLQPSQLAGRIKEQGLERIVVAGGAPGFFKQAFTRAMVLAGQNPEEVRLASFREHGATAADATERAKAIVACGIRAVPYGLAAISATTAVNPATLVIGAGVAGIQAALEIADAGKTVYLVEKTGTIGGHMAMFDKTFPTLDCAACILTPKMVAVSQHPLIHLLTCSELEQVRGGPGAYKVMVRKHPRRVDEKSCVSCNSCAEVCPVHVASEFDNGIAERRAIYIPFPQAVPNTYLVDEKNCTWIASGGKKCGVCLKKCPKDCIHLDASDELLEIPVGQIVLATGYDIFEASRIERYGYGTLPNVLTALEFERLTNASGPTGGKIVTKIKQYNKRLKADEWVFDLTAPAPRSVAIIHCVGSRDSNYNPYCSRVCCMYSLKFAHLVKEKLPEADCYEFYIDMRAFGKGYEEFAERIKSEGAFVVRGRTSTVCEQAGRMVVKGEDILGDRVVELTVDMVILAVGLIPAQGTDELARMLGIQRDADGWFSELDYNGDPTDTERGGVFVAGVCQGPKDIPDTVAQASAVAAGVLKGIQSGKIHGNRDSILLSDVEARAKRYASLQAR